MRVSPLKPSCVGVALAESATRKVADMPMLIELLEGRRLLAAAATPVLIDGDGVVLDAIAGIRFRGRVGDFQAAPDPNAATGTPIGRTRWQATIHWGDDTPPELTKPKRLRVGSLPVVGT